MKSLTAIAAAVAGMFALGAQAAPSTDGFPTLGTGDGSGDVFLAVVDGANTQSILIDLSGGGLGDLTITDVRNFASGNPGGSFTLNALPGLNDYLANFAGSGFRYNLFGLSNVQDMGARTVGTDFGAGVTVDTPFAPQTGGTLQGSMGNVLAQWVLDNNAAGLTDNSFLLAGNTDLHFWDPIANDRHGNNILGGDATVDIDLTVDFDFLRKQAGNLDDDFVVVPEFMIIPGSDNLPIVSERLGTWTLASNGELTFTAVPVPGAVWLLGSAVAGLAGVGSRRKAKA